MSPKSDPLLLHTGDGKGGLHSTQIEAEICARHKTRTARRQFHVACRVGMVGGHQRNRFSPLDPSEGVTLMLKYIVVALGLSACLSAGTEIPAAVPSYLLAAARRPPIEFAMALLSASVACGLEIREPEDRPHEGPVSKIGPEGNVLIIDVVKAFEAHHGDYRAAIVGGVLVIRPRKDVLPFLDAPSTINRPTPVTGVMAAARRVFFDLRPGLSGGVAVNSLGHPGADIRVVLDGSGGRKVIDTLNQIVVQARGLAWVVITRKEQGGNVRIVSFGQLAANGSRRRVDMRRP